ncbi:hypothetical protein M758_11G166300 [Ceratodon purpureus]|nr:hypothetical protein M758_11G166300 [Ceratodon purpureus]
MYCHHASFLFHSTVYTTPWFPISPILLLIPSLTISRQSPHLHSSFTTNPNKIHTDEKSLPTLKTLYPGKPKPQDAERVLCRSESQPMVPRPKKLLPAAQITTTQREFSDCSQNIG